MLKQKQVGKIAKKALSRSQQSGYYTACLSLKSERCQQWSMLSALLVNIKCFEKQKSDLINVNFNVADTNL